jgi:mannitol/fructose-specific phosphotransferase system IIA component (Ntr-type)
MDLNDFFGPNPTIINLRAENRWEAVDELIDHLVANHKIKTERQSEAKGTSLTK